ncbi:helix-turn-helix transcriptional regulator [Micromonospora sp. FIMYZ51]|uniref:helix-turn-helix domain-containing protein n=1 Tax=Micromonospora sp. FIMYZ51 TaxID=3051832 RepID=UPI00311DAB6D
MTGPVADRLRAVQRADPDLAGVAYRHPRRQATVHDGPPPARRAGRRRLELLPERARPEVLRRWRIRQRLTQTQVAGLLQVPPGRVARWERGEDVMPVEMLARLGVDAGWMEAGK